MQHGEHARLGKDANSLPCNCMQHMLQTQGTNGQRRTCVPLGCISGSSTQVDAATTVRISFDVAPLGCLCAGLQECI
jgi:hypothetical protein